jgi:general secretion pathway protein K
MACNRGWTTPPSEPSGENDGFALIVVLWTLVLIAFVTTLLVANGRIEVRIAGNLVDNAVVAAAADGAIYRTIFNLLDPDRDRRWALDGGAHELAIGDCRVTVRLEDETSRINPNLASPALLEALLRTVGSDPQSASRLAAAIGEWTGATAGISDAAAAEYRSAGLDYAPPGEPLETIDELQRVRGMTPAIYAAIRSHLSLFAPAEPNPAHADPVVAAALAAIREPGTSKVAPPPQPTLTARVAIKAQGPANASATRLAIVRVSPNSGTYSVLLWGNAAE